MSKFFRWFFARSLWANFFMIFFCSLLFLIAEIFCSHKKLFTFWHRKKFYFVKYFFFLSFWKSSRKTSFASASFFYQRSKERLFSSGNRRLSLLLWQKKTQKWNLFCVNFFKRIKKKNILRNKTFLDAKKWTAFWVNTIFSIRKNNEQKNIIKKFAQSERAKKIIEKIYSLNQ